MKKLSFPASSYTLNETTKSYEYKGTYPLLPPLEMLWSLVDNSPAKDLGKAEIKTLKKIKNKIKVITITKDSDNDSRISLLTQTLLLEDSEHTLLKRIVDNTQLGSTRVTETICALYDIIDDAVDYSIEVKSELKLED